MNGKAVTRIGIWMPYGPGIGIRGEGLLRLLTLVADGIDPARYRFAFFCPVWLKRDLENEIEDYPPIRRTMFSVRSCWSPFTIMTLLIFFPQIWHSIGPQRRRRGEFRLRKWLARLSRRTLIAARRLALRLLAASVFIPVVLILVAVSLWLAWTHATVVLAIGTSVSLADIWDSGLSGLRQAWNWIGRTPLAVVLPAVAGAIALWLRVGPNKGDRPRRPWSHAGLWARTLIGRLHWVRANLYHLVQAREFRQMARLANRTADVDLWLTIHAEHDSARHLVKPVVSLFPDLVYFDCPSGVDERRLRRLRVRAHRLIERADALIVFSENVRRRQLAGNFKLAASKRIHVIPHAMIDYVAGCPELARLDRLADGSVTARQVNAAVIRAFLARRSARARQTLPSRHPEVQILQYLEELPFEDIGYVFCSTQNRPYKNVVGLVKAVRLLIRERYRNIKLVMTGYMNFDDGEDKVAQYVRAEQLHWDVVSIHRVPRLVHAALFRGAALTVHPSFFEGGFPFCFSESVSLGTPALLSRTPNTLDLFPRDAIEPFLFDPYSVTDLADKIEWALDNRAQVLDVQTQLYHEAKASRTWATVGAEYARVFESVTTRIPVGEFRGRPDHQGPELTSLRSSVDS